MAATMRAVIRRPVLVLASVFALTASTAADTLAGMSGSDGGDARSSSHPGIVDSIVNAPIAPDGTTTGRPADFVIDLAADMDPAVPGRSLLAGRTIRVTLPHAFERDPAVPFRSLFTDPTCVPLNIRCNSAFLLQGWPQHPVGFPPTNIPGLWAVDFDEATRSVVVTALQDLLARPPAEPGIKQIHVLLAGFTNPRPGLYRIRVAAETGPNGEPEVGWGRLRVQPHIRPAIAIAGAFNPGVPNTIFQRTTPGSPTPLPYDLLLWDRSGAPLLDVGVHQVDPRRALLVQGEHAVGAITIDAPAGAHGQQVFNGTPSFAVRSPVVGVPTARLTVFFTAGDAAGEYVLRFHLFGGNAFETFVEVE